MRGTDTLWSRPRPPWLSAVARCALVALALALAAGCATATVQAPVVERSTPVGDPPPPTYVVRPRDSLYAIAWRFGLDYAAVARWNGIGPPYTIHPGQTLALRATRRQTPTEVPSSAAQTPAQSGEAPPSRVTTDRPAAPPTRPAPTTTATATQRPRPAPAKPVVQATPPAPVRPAKPTPPSPAAESGPEIGPAPAPKPAATASDGRWRWPVDARPENGFGGGNTGVDFAVPAGQAVVAAGPGKVVYAGPGLAGFRHLVIVEHGGGYLSAYSLNADPVVAEGKNLASGARLAAVGGAGAVDRRLHFEIRRNGSPVDPGSVIGRL